MSTQTNSVVLAIFSGLLIGTLDGLLSINGFTEGAVYYILLYSYIFAVSIIVSAQRHMVWINRILLFTGTSGVITGLWALQWMLMEQVFKPSLLYALMQSGSINLGLGAHTSFGFYILSTVAQLFGGILCFAVSNLLLLFHGE